MGALIDVALPVYNGAQFISQTLDSLLSQTVQDIRITVVDNASEDGTADVADLVARRDSRVRVIRRERNAGAVDNFNLAIQQATAPFVMWASDHDRHDPTYVEKCLSVLEEEPSVVLCYPAADWIDRDGRCIEKVRSVLETRGLSRVSRLNVALWGAGPYNYAVYGLMRRSALEQLRCWPHPYPDTVAPDIVMLTELALVGEFAYIPETLFHLRRMEDFGNFDIYAEKLGKRARSRRQALLLYLQFMRRMVAGPHAHAESRSQALAGQASALTCGL